MITFKEFIKETFDIVHNDKESRTYSQKIGDHVIRTKFHSRSTEKSVPGRYEITVTRQGPHDDKQTDMFSGRESMSSSDRARAALAVRAHVNHHIKNEKPYEYVAAGNEPKKREMYKNAFNSLANRHGAAVTHSDKYSAMRFKPSTEEQSSKEQQIKQANKEKILAALRSRRW